MSDPTRAWPHQAERATGSVENMLALASEIFRSSQADPAQKDAAKKVISSARTVMRQKVPTGMQIEVLRLRFASLRATLINRAGAREHISPP